MSGDSILQARDIAIDPFGDVLTTGYFRGTADFDPGVGTANLTSAGGDDVFVSRLNAVGDHVSAGRVGGVGRDRSFAVTTDSASNAYTTGYFEGTADFDPGAATANLTSSGVRDVFVSQLLGSPPINTPPTAEAGGAYSGQIGESIQLDGSLSADAQEPNATLSFEWDLDYDGATFDVDLTGQHPTFTNLDVTPRTIALRVTDSGGLEDINTTVYAPGFGSLGFGFALQQGSPTSGDSGDGIVIDASGNIYTTGSFGREADFDPGPGVLNLTPLGSRDVFLSKVDSSGNLVWVRQIGGAASYAEGLDVAVDASGNVYATGRFFGTVDFDPGAGVQNLSGASDRMFVVKLDSVGDYVWAGSNSSATTNASSWGFGIATDSSGNVYTTGRFSDTFDFDPGPGISNLSAPSGSEIFVSKWDNNGDFVWAADMDSSSGNSGIDRGLDIAVDSDANIYVTGYFRGTVDFDPGPYSSPLTTLSTGSSRNAFVFKLDTDRNFVWAKNIADSASDSAGEGLTVDAQGNVYTTGWFNDTADFDPGSGTNNRTSQGGLDAFVGKLDPGGNLEWIQTIGGSGSDVGRAVAVDFTGGVYATGMFQNSVKFEPGPGSTTRTSNGQSDLFITRYNSAGRFLSATTVGGTRSEEVQAIDIDSSGNVFTTGRFRATVDFDPGTGSAPLTGDNFGEIYIWKTTSAPTADAGEIYTARIGETINLDGSASSDPDEPNATLTFEWDLNYDGSTFDVDASGEQTSYVNDSEVPRTIALRVTDSLGNVSIDTVPFVQRLYWQGDVDQYWSTPGNWNTAIDGTGGSISPASGQFVLSFDTSVTGFTSPVSINDLTGLGDVRLEIIDSSPTVDFSISGNAITVPSGYTIRHQQTAGTSSDVSLPLTIDDNTFQVDSGTLTLGAVIGGTTLSKTGAGTLSLTAANSYQGSTNIQDGTLRVTDNDGMGAVEDVVVASDAVWEIGGTGNRVIRASTVFLAGTLRMTVGGNLVATNVNVSGATIDVASSDNDLFFAASISGSDGFTKVGEGELRLTRDSDYTGQTIVADGLLAIQEGPSLGAVGAGNETIVQSGGSLELEYTPLFPTKFEPITLSGTGFDGTGALIVSGSYRWQGDITLGDDATIFGTDSVNLYLDGAIDTSSHTLTIDGVQRTVIGGVVSGGGQVFKSDSAGILYGTGTINDPLTIAEGSLGAGPIGPGILNTASVSFNDNSTLKVNLRGTIPGSSAGYSQLRVDGNVTIANNVTLDVNALLGFVPSVDDSFVVIDNDGADPISGIFAGLEDGYVMVVADRVLQVDYQGGDGNDLELTVVDEFAEYEANDTIAQAIPITAGDVPIKVRGNINAAFDSDYYTFTLDAPTGVFFDIDAQDIGISNLDSVLEVFSSTNTTDAIAANDDGYDFDGFKLNDEAHTNASRDASLYADLDAGTYFVRVKGYSVSSGSYQLIVEGSTEYSSNVPVLNSFPGAPNTLYLDFNGHSGSEESSMPNFDVWAWFYGSYSIPGFDLDGNTSRITPAERMAIENVWRVVSEDYSAFDVNVTTVEPGNFSDGVAYRLVIGGDGSELSSVHAGKLGLASRESFARNGSSDNVGFAFAESFNSWFYGTSSSARIMSQALEMGNTASHEFGHALGLLHYGGSNPQRNGIMHTPDFGLNRERWQAGLTHDGADGSTQPPVKSQDDVSVISNPFNTVNNTVSYRADLEGSSIPTATPLTAIGDGDFRGKGIIHSRFDWDWFRFTSSGDTTITVALDEYSANLDATLRVYNSSGNQIASVNDPESAGASINMDLDYGTYFVVVASRGGRGEFGRYDVLVDTSADGDVDGVGNDVEDNAPNSGDGNQDGIADRRRKMSPLFPMLTLAITSRLPRPPGRHWSM